jgi:glyoxylase-like metal-dependent hydrolase (beta-lactamase superfamily II)
MNQAAKQSSMSTSPNPAPATPVPTGRWKWNLLDAGPILLDGGGMFGIIPRVLWTKSITPDNRNRIRLNHNCLLLESVDEPGRHVLIEVGSGDKLDAKNRDIFGLTDRTIVTALTEANVAPQSLHDVIVSHLHFDHAAALTRRVQPGETPDWHDDSYPAGVKLTFGNARIHVQKREWHDAIANNSVMTRTYFPDHLIPLRDRLVLHESPPPFELGQVPPRQAMPAEPASARQREILPGIFSLLVPGHTWGQQALLFVDDRGRTVVFTPDCMPTVHHAGPAYSLAYDVEPYISMITRHWFLDEAARNDWLLVLDHEPVNPLQRVRPDGRGWFTLTPEPAVIG